MFTFLLVYSNPRILGIQKPVLIVVVVQKSMLSSESKEQRGEYSDFLFLGRTVRADIFGRLFLGSQKSSQMAPYAVKSKNEESVVDINNLLSKKYPISKFDLTKL